MNPSAARELKPAIRYCGGKSRLAPTFARFMPDAEWYVDPFTGGANVYWHVAGVNQFRKYWINDIRTGVNLSAIKRSGHKTMIELDKRDGAVWRETFKRYKGQRYMTDEALIWEFFLTFDGGGYGRSGPRHRYGGVSLHQYARKMRMCCDILNRTATRISTLDYVKVLERVPNDASAFVFLDPPYPNASVPAYENTDIDHVELLTILKRARFSWMLCGFPNPIWDDFLEREPLFRQPADLVRRGRSGMYTRKDKGGQEEVCWTNYDPPRLAKAA